MHYERPELFRYGNGVEAQRKLRLGLLGHDASEYDRLVDHMLGHTVWEAVIAAALGEFEHFNATKRAYFAALRGSSVDDTGGMSRAEQMQQQHEVMYGREGGIQDYLLQRMGPEAGAAFYQKLVEHYESRSGTPPAEDVSEKQVAVSYTESRTPRESRK